MSQSSPPDAAGAALGRERLQALERLDLQDARDWFARTTWTHRVLRRLRQRLVTLVGPGLGVALRQHAPRPLDVPRGYRNTPLPEPTPSISLVTPTLNRARFLESTVLSVRSQGWPKLEYRVRDGGSADGSQALLERIASDLDWDSQADGGQSAALNRGFAATEGAIMGWLNADDVLLPGALAYIARYFAAHPQVDVLYGHRVLIDEEGLEIGRWVMPPHRDEALSWANYIPQEATFWRRRIWDRVGGRIDESYDFAMDWELFVRFRDAGASFAVVPRFLAGFRIHPAQKSAALMATLGHAECTRLRRRIHGRDVARGEIERALEPFLNRSALWLRLYRLGLLRY